VHPSGLCGILKVGVEGVATLSERDIQRNMRAVAHAIAQQELEGLTVPAATVADLYRAARGEIDTDEVRRNIRCRTQKLTDDAAPE
jgi:hypothetical protein